MSETTLEYYLMFVNDFQRKNGGQDRDRDDIHVDSAFRLLHKGDYNFNEEPSVIAL